jgi:arylsulfatase
VKGGGPFYCYIATNAPHATLEVRPEDEARYIDKVQNRNVAKFFGMIANIDDNVGRLLDKLGEWNLEDNTLVIFMNDNGGTFGTTVHNAGMRGSKATPWLGGTRASSLWRWPGTLVPGDCDRLTAHIDFFPTIAELAGTALSDKIRAQVEGRSLVPLLENPTAEWAERILFTHVGRWPAGAPIDDYKYAKCSVRTSGWHLVCDSDGPKQWQLFDVKKDAGETTDVLSTHPDVVRKLNAAYDDWWKSLPKYLVKEDAIGPPINPVKEWYLTQFGGGPSNER